MTAQPAAACVSAPAHPLKILQIITKGETGGAQTHVQVLCASLAAHAQVQLEIAVGGRDPSPPLERSLRALGLPVHRVAALSNSLAPWQLLQAVRALVHLVRQRQPHLLHAHSAGAGVVARLAGRLTGVPVVYTVHGFAFKAGAPWPRRLLAWGVESLCAPLTQHMVCVSEHERQLTRWLPLARQRCSTILNAVPDAAQRAMQPVSAAPTSVRLVLVARMAPPKRPDILLHALALLRTQHGLEPPTTIVGDGPHLAAHQALAQQLHLHHVVFMGERNDVAHCLAQHQVFVLLSEHEGLPISILEAMRAGLAILASDLPGLRELLPPPSHGVLVENTPAAVATALQRLLHDGPLRQQLAQRARLRYEQAHSPAHMAQAVLNVYRTLAP